MGGNTSISAIFNYVSPPSKLQRQALWFSLLQLKYGTEFQSIILYCNSGELQL